VKHLTLRQARTAKGWTQAQLEEKSGVPQARISQIESGVTADPLDSTVRALEGALALKRGTLVFGREALAS
jgi:transcriptional regulator with XRE-family HTH domain